MECLIEAPTGAGVEALPWLPSGVASRTPTGGGASKAPSASRATAIHRSRSSAVPARASAWIAVAYAIPLIHGVRPPP
jgi:hypothetical protein